MRLDDGLVFRLAADAAAIGIVVADEAGAILYANSWVGQIFRCQVADVTGRSIETLIPTIDQFVSLKGKSFSSSPPGATGATCSLPGRRADGTDAPLEVSWTIAEDASSQVLVLSIVDIGERVHLRTQLAEVSSEHAVFERLVTDLTARFVMLQPADVGDTIVDSLRQIAEQLDLDRSTWWQAPSDGTDALVAYTWTRPEYRLMPDRESAAAQVPWLLSRMRRGEVVSFADPEEVPSGPDREGLKRFGAKSGAAVPFLVNGEFRGALGFSSIRRKREWPAEVIDRIRLVAGVFGQALIRKETDEELRAALGEVRRLRDHLALENVQLRRDARLLSAPRLVVAESPVAKRVLEQIESVAPTPATVLLLGETGTGKEVFAQAIHRSSDRAGRAMVTVNCGAIPATLIESELFGREKGAYTGALARQIGRFEMATNSTIFLDEIGELPLDAQVKLLRVIQERVIERLGGGQPVKIDVRIIAATNRNLEKAVAEGTFREDLYYRLNVFPVTIPPLRERVEDIPALVWTFIEEYAATFRKPIESLSKDSLAALKSYPWPGNVRELRNVVERAVIISKGPQLVIDLPSSAVSSPPRKSTRLHDLEIEHIRGVLERVGWRVRGPGGAAELLGLKPNTLDSRIAKLGITRQPRRTTN